MTRCRSPHAVEGDVEPLSADAATVAVASTTTPLRGRVASVTSHAVAADGAVTVVQPPTRRVLVSRLEALLPADERAAFREEAQRVEAGRALAALGAATPEPAPGTAPPAPAGWRVAGHPGAELVLLARDDGGPAGAHGLVLSRVRLAADLRAHLAAAATLPAGFDLRLDLDPADVRAALAGAQSLRPPASLPDQGLSWTLVHTDVPGQLEALATRSSWQRTGLLLAAAFALVATVVAVVALAREARLAALKSAFVASVSHELRTPVAAIQLLTENLERGRVSDVARYHAALRTEGRRLGRLVDDVLDLSRLERGRPPRLERQPLATRELVDSFRTARSQAISGNREAFVVIDVDNQSYRIDREGQTQVLPGDLSVDLRTAASEQVDETRGRIRFFPDGTSSTARIVLANTNNAAINIELRGLTGITRVGSLVPVNQVAPIGVTQ